MIAPNRAPQIGLASFMLPEAFGGGGMTDCLTGCIVQEELSHGCAPPAARTSTTS